MPEKEKSHSTLPRNSRTPLVLAHVDETRNSQHATRKYQFKLMHEHRNLLSSVNFFIELKTNRYNVTGLYFYAGKMIHP